MPVIRLLPNDSHPFGVGMGVQPNWYAPHEALNDGNDWSYVILQISNAEPTKFFTGEFPSLPDGAGVVNGMVFSVQGYRVGGHPPIFQAQFLCGENLTAHITATMPEDPPPLWFSSANITTHPDVGYTNAMQWMVGVNKLGGDNMTCHIHEFYVDVDFNFINGVVTTVIFQWLGPLIAVGLAEMPKLSLELFRRSGIRLRSRELEAVWREMRQYRNRRLFLPAIL